MKSLEGRFVLAPDATALAVTDFPVGFRNGLASDPDSVVWTRVRGRSPSIVVSGDGNRLLEQFLTPAAIPQAVVALSAAQGLDPEDVLVQGYALLREAVNRGLLLSPREWARAHIAPTLQSGEQVGRWRLAGPIQILDDSEVHRVVDGNNRRGVLKLARTRSAAGLLAREAKVLRRLEGRLTPALLDQSRRGEHRFLVLEWREGQPPDVVAESLRTTGLAARPHLRKLALGILQAYAGLHEQGVVHGDVHPRNILIGSHGRVTVLDFGQGVLDGIAPPPGRAGVASYMEPEVAAALLHKRRPLPASVVGEQYAVAALLFELLTGQQYLDFHHEAPTFLKQVVREPPRTFQSLGLPSWPEVESVLRRALAKASSDRFPSMAAMVRSFRQGSAPRNSTNRKHAVSDWLGQELDRLTQARKRQAAGRGTGPQLAVYTGEAGQALALLRVARRRDDPELLGAADARCLWSEYRAVMPRRARARLEPGDLLGGTAGIALVRAAVGHARSDDREAAGAVRYFAGLARTRPTSPELSAGTAGLLLGATRLLSLSGLGTAERRLLREVQDRTAHTLLQDGRRAGGPVQPLPLANLGMAHGWAGILYALLAWQESRPGRRPPPEVARWLDQLDQRAEAIGRGRRWPWLSRRHRRLVHGGSMTGWCNGSAGFALLYAAAARVLGRPVDLVRAEAAAWDAWTHPPPGPDLCCGATGAAYAMLALARATGQQRWVSRARSLAEHAFHRREAGTGRTQRPHSLFQGTTGLVSLLVDLETPASATFPLIESLP